jgi:endonuclease VIII-like 1
MPELAEIKIMADYINEVSKDKHYTSISFSESAWDRNLGIVQPSDLQIFSMSAESRGKELMLRLIQGEETFMKISFSMGMSGNWLLVPATVAPPKHTHLKFNAIGGDSLCLVDVRRFARWKISQSWSVSRGPCPFHEFDAFKQNIEANLHRREFDKPIHLVLMNQKYFNGIGNYLRAEILFRAAQDPFIDARTALTLNPSILELCKQLPTEAYILGGGQLKDWDNPFDLPANNFSDWIQCYGKPDASSIVDNNGRKLWYHKLQVSNEI